MSLPEAKLLLKEDDELIKEVFDYWSRKRKNSKANSLIPTVKQEKRDGSSTNDPYVAFRRRTEKMQTRKVCEPYSSIGILTKSPSSSYLMVKKLTLIYLNEMFYSSKFSHV